MIKTENFHSELDDDDDLFLDIDMSEAVENQLLLVNQNYESNLNSSIIPNSQPEIIPKRRNQSREVPVVNEFEDIMNDDDDDWLLAVSQEQHQTEFENTVVLPDSTTNEIKEEELNEVIRKKSYLETNYPFKIDSCNLVVISQLKECSNEEINGKTFIVFCKVYSVTEKLGIKFKKWKIGVLLTDESDGVLLVKFDSNLMEDIIGHTALEMETMKNLTNEKPTIADEMMRVSYRFLLLILLINFFFLDC